MGNSQNQHYISQVLLRRFSHVKQNGDWVFRYDLTDKQWNELHTSKTFSWRGYTDIQQGVNTIESSFHKLENSLAKALEEIERATKSTQSLLSKKAHKTIAQYFAYVRLLSPFTKAASPVDLVRNLNTQLFQGSGDLCAILQFSGQQVREYTKAVEDGQRVILENDNYHQLIHGIQFERTIGRHIKTFTENVRWKVAVSPINIPLADVAIIDVEPPKDNEFDMLYSLPISPKLILAGFTFRDKVKQAKMPANGIITEHLSKERGEHWAEYICLSAQAGLVSQIEIPDVEKKRIRAEQNHSFRNIHKTNEVIASIHKMTIKELRFKIVSADEFNVFCHEPFE